MADIALPGSIEPARREKTPAPVGWRRGLHFTLRTNNERAKARNQLQLPVLTQHRPAIAADAPALRGKRRAAVQETVPAHAGGAVAEFRGGRPARRQFGEIDGIGGGGAKAKNAQKNSHGYR
jgi:hypothetical protein